jgi:serine/threonine protein kinase
VRRLVEYEDYTLRLMQDYGIPTAAPGGIVELTPEREYLLVTDFFEGAVEMGDADVDDGVIDEGLQLIRQLWDSGLAHRDIKPANLLVRDGRVLLIDVAFAQVRPSPWRQAVDLANMMLVLAVRTDAERVYQRALQFFTPGDIAEAFAAVRGIASPSQLRAAMKQDGRDLIAQFRALAPERPPISLQRWGARRIVYAVAVLAGGAVAVLGLYSLLRPSPAEVVGTPTCGTDNVMVLMAQSVPSAVSVPCISAFPTGWSLGGVRVDRDKGEFWLDSDRAGAEALQVTLRPPQDCNLASTTPVPSDEVGTMRFDSLVQTPSGPQSTRYYLFDGGCVTYHFSFDPGANPSLIAEAEDEVGFLKRSDLVEAVGDRTGLRLCGAGAPCPGGGP